MSRPTLDAVIFDKDGTIVDFHATWGPAVGAAFGDVFDDVEHAQSAAAAVGYDLATEGFHANSVAVHCSNAELSALVDPFGDGARFIDRLAVRVLDHVTPAPHADAVLAALRDDGVALAVATNDDEATTRAQLDRLGWGATFEHIVGSDSGHGTKPDPGMVQACLHALGRGPGRAAMVGDSATDLGASRRAGTLGVLVGQTPELAALADVVIADLRSLPAVLGR